MQKETQKQLQRYAKWPLTDLYIYKVATKTQNTYKKTKNTRKRHKTSTKETPNDQKDMHKEDKKTKQPRRDVK